MELIGTAEAKRQEEQAIDAKTDMLIAAQKEAHERIVQREAERAEEKQKSDPLEKPVDVEAHVKRDPALSVAAVATDHAKEISENGGKDKSELAEPPKEPVKITAEEKERFLDALVSGERFMLDYKLFNGRMSVRFRCRSVGESEAIESYCRNQMVSGAISGPIEYTDLTRLSLLVAQVDRVNDIQYPTMRAPLLITESEGKKNPPGWEAELATWRNKPEAVVTAISNALQDFEAKYWAMVEASRDVNFWNAGESTVA